MHQKNVSVVQWILQKADVSPRSKQLFVRNVKFKLLPFLAAFLLLVSISLLCCSSTNELKSCEQQTSNNITIQRQTQVVCQLEKALERARSEENLYIADRGNVDDDTQRVGMSEASKPGFPRRHRTEWVLYTEAPHTHAKLGNLLFVYASALGMTSDLGVTLAVCPSLYPLTQIFQISAPIRLPPKANNLTVITGKFATFDDTYLMRDVSSHLITGSYLQSWKYFRNAEAVVRQQFTFLPDILERARAYINRVTEEAAKRLGVARVTLVGVHVRRGDLTSDPSYNLPPTAYYIQAMLHFARIHPSVHFLVASDDPAWCRRRLVVTPHTVTLPPETTSDPGYDLAVLSLCDHVIGSVGTFSWWAGWLAGGDVVMYRHPIARQGALWSDFRGDDFFPPHWTLLSG